MDTNVISDFAASEFSATVDPALAFAPRYALHQGYPGITRISQSHTVRRNESVPSWVVRSVDGCTVVATTFITGWFARGHLTHDQAITLAAADIVAVLTFFLISRVRDFRFSNFYG
jgi:hypothetical protein